MQPAESPFEEFRLLTSTGHYVVTAIVPKFRPQATVIIWGERFFVLRARHESRDQVSDEGYYEAFTVAAVNSLVEDQ